MAKRYDISFRCTYPGGHYTSHRQVLELREIPKWIEAYRFTHPQVASITVKVWTNKEDEACG